MVNTLIGLTAEFTNNYVIPIAKTGAKWLRATATVHIEQKEWDVWRMTQMVVQFYHQGQVVKENVIRLQRLLNDMETKTVFIDVKLPEKTFDTAVVLFRNSGGDKPAQMDDLKVELFDIE